MTEAQYLGGRILLAMPGMGDPRFERSATFMCLHDENGAFGIGVGQLRQDLSFRELLSDVGIDPGKVADCPVHHGGPVETGRGFVLHSTDWGGEGTVEVTPFCALSGSVDVLRAIAEERGPSRWLFALGYAGWAGGQLEGEMRRHGWFAAKGSAALLFETPAEKRWKAAWLAEGIDPALLASETGRA